MTFRVDWADANPRLVDVPAIAQPVNAVVVSCIPTTFIRKFWAGRYAVVATEKEIDG